MTTLPSILITSHAPVALQLDFIMSLSQLHFTCVVSSRYQVESCAFSHDGTMLSACLSDGSVRLYTVNHQPSMPCEGGGARPPETLLTLERVFRLHRSNVWCVAFSVDDSLLCSCSSDKMIMLYSTRSMSLLTIFSCYHTDTVWCCCFTEMEVVEGSATVMASGSSDCTVAIFNSRTGQIWHKLTGFQGAVDSLAFSPDGRTLCTGSRDCKVRVWYNLAPGEQPVCQVLSTEEEPARMCRFSPLNSNILVTSAGSDHSLYLWDLSRANVAPPLNTSLASSSKCFIHPRLKLSGHCNIVWDCCFIKEGGDSPLLVSCSGDRTVRSVYCISMNCPTRNILGGDMFSASPV